MTFVPSRSMHEVVRPKVLLVDDLDWDWGCFATAGIGLCTPQDHNQFPPLDELCTDQGSEFCAGRLSN